MLSILKIKLIRKYKPFLIAMLLVSLPLSILFYGVGQVAVTSVISLQKSDLAIIILFTCIIFLVLLLISLLWIVKRDAAGRRESEKMLRRIMDSSLDVICTIDVEGRFVHISGASVAIWGYKPEELVGRLYMDLVAEQDKEVTTQVATSIMSGVSYTTFQNRYVRPDGELVPILWSAKWSTEDQLMYCIAKNATEKEKLEKEFQNDLKHLIQYLPAAVYTCDLSGNIKIYNRAAIELWGKEPIEGKDKWGGYWKMYNLDGEPIEKENCLMAQTIKSGVQVHGQEVIIERPNGDRRHVLPYPILSYNSSGILNGAINMLVDITDTKKATEHLQQSEAALAEAQQIAKIGSWSLDAQSQRLTCSDELYHVFDTDREGFKESFTSFLDYVDEVDHQFAIDTTLKAFSDGEAYDVEFRINTGRGEPKVINVLGNAQKDAQGQVVRLYGTAQDITERKRFESDLLASEEKYKLLFYQAPLPKYIYDLSTLQVLDVNQSAIEQYGYTREEFLKLSAKDLRPADEVQAMVDALQSKKDSTGLIRYGLWNHVKKNGSRIKVDISAHRIVYDKRVCLIVIANDVTEKARAEDELKVSNERWEMLSKVTFDGIWDWDLKTGELLWGENFEILFGHKIESTNGNYNFWLDHLHPDDKERVKESMDLFLKGPEVTWHAEYRFLKANGEYAFCSDRGVLINGDNGIPARMIGAIRDVTESKLAEERLRIEKVFSETLIEAIPDGMVGFNGNGEIILFNKQAEHLFGYGREEIVGLPVATLMPSEGHLSHHLRRKDYFADPTEARLQESNREMLGLRKDGSFFPADIRLSSVDSHKGKLVISSVRDITDKKSAEKQIRDSEKNLKAILDSTQEAIYLLDLNYQLILLNEHAHDLIKRGYDVYCKPGDIFPDLFDPELKSKLELTFQKVLAGEKLESDRMVPLGDGTAYYYSNYFPVRDEDGAIIGICCSSKDITERKKNEEIVKKANAEKEEYQYRFKAILDYSPQAILIKDMEGKYIFSNKAFLSLFDLDRDNEVGEQLKTVFDDQLAREEFLGNSREREDKIKIKEWSQQVVLPSGEIMEMEVIKFPLYDRQRSLFGICTICKDITEQMKHQQQLVQARESAENAERLQEQFLANMSHELRTPMNGIIGMVNLLMTSSSLQPDQKGRLEVIQRSSDTLLNLVNDILDLSKIKAGMLTIEKVNFDLHQTVAGTALLFKERAKEKGVKLAVVVDPFIPKLLTGDHHRLNQILNNLLSNAVKFTAKGYVRLEASIHSEMDEQVIIEFVTSDSGIGIDSDKLHTIFDNFSQTSEDISSKYGGTGLGLAITKRLIEMQGGNIHVDSVKDVGTCFTFTLPYAIAKDKQDEIHTYHQEPLVPSIKHYDGKRALIVEDNEINQLVLESALKQHHLTTVIANNGQEAVHLLEAGNQFDIIFMDLRMRLMNGFETTAYIRQKLHLKVPIIILTASVLRNERDRSLEIGASDYMAKPFAMSDLSHTLERFLTLTNFLDKHTAEVSTQELSSVSEYDISRLLELEDPQYIQQVFDLFIEKVPKYFMELKSILESGNYDAFLEKTHMLRGSLSTVQIAKIHNLVNAMEESVLEKKKLEELDPMLEACRSYFEMITPAIRTDLEQRLSAMRANNENI